VVSCVVLASMRKRNDRAINFKTYNQDQPMLLPPSLNELIEANHPVRVVSRVIEQINIQPLIKQYKPGGASSFHPQMLLKVLVYAYINNIYSSRKIEQALKKDIEFMWLSGMNTPDHNTINRFRSDRLKEVLKNIFAQVVQLLVDEGLLDIKELYVDGTKIEANANRYTFVWGKAIRTSREKIKQQLDELWKYAQTIAAEEMDDTDPSGFDKIDAEKVAQTVQQINEALKDKPGVDAKVKQKLKYAQKNWPANLNKYDEQEKILGEHRSSYSKTDTDATFMRLKEDHMKNGQLKAAYNLQISTNNQFIASYSIHQKTTDTTTLASHLSQHEQHLQAPEVIVADAGYGSEENYQLLEEKQITAYIKHNQFDRNQSSNIRSKQPFSADKLHYDKELDCYYCPMGQPMQNIGTSIRTTATGYKQHVTYYRAKNCNGCPLRGQCHKANGNRTIEVNHNLNRLKQQADERLLSEKGVKHRKKRCCDVEPVFASIKNNHHFRRFMLRGIEKVSVETGLLALAHNLRKKAA
jgi:transposase